IVFRRKMQYNSCKSFPVRPVKAENDGGLFCICNGKEEPILNSCELISAGGAFLGLELGSTRIKAVLIDPDNHAPIASGSYGWENRWEGGYWTYSMEDVWTGLQTAYAD